MKKLNKTGILMAVVMLTVLVLGGCGKNIDDSEVSGNDSATKSEASDNSGAYPITVTDDLGVEVVINEEPQTIVSLGPCETEIICALGAIDKLVGRSDSDNYPAEVTDIPSIGEYYQPNTELIIGTAPDLVISTNYMEDDVRAQMNDAGIAVYVCYDGGLDQTLNNILNIGKILNRNDEAQKLVDDMTAKREEIKAACANVDQQRSVFIDLGDFYSAGTGSLLGDMIDEINAINVAADQEGKWPQLTMEQVVAADPDVYISTYPSVDEIKQMPGMASVTAVIDDNVYCFGYGTVEGDLLQRSGPRIMAGLELLARTVYPECF